MTKTKSYRIDDLTQARLNGIRDYINKDYAKQNIPITVDETTVLKIAIAWYAEKVCKLEIEGA